ncbi:MAG: DUF3108 domain-containing protein [Acidobacteria bacterium]|nr:DUF3108 domain-containing protein [Acidobacteriota bacterium]
MMAASRSTCWRRVSVVYAAAAVLLTWPLALHQFSLLGSTQGPGDLYLNLWILGWDLQALLHHPATILSGRVFDANIFHPATGTLAYSDHLLLQAAALSPIYLLTGSLTFCYNVLFVGSLLLCALAMHAYVRDLSGGSSAPWVAGAAWGVAPYHFSHLIHVQLQALYFLPLTFLFLHRVAVRGRRIDACLLGLTLAAQALSSAYYGGIGGIAVLIAAVVYTIGVEWPQGLVVVRRSTLAAVIGTALAAPAALKYWTVQQREGFGRSLHEASQGSATMGSYLEVPAENLVYGHAVSVRSHDPSDQRHKASEQNLFPGFVLLGLAMAGVATLTRRDVLATTLALLAVSIAGVVLSLGPDGARWLYASLYEHVFGFQAIRASARFAVLALFGLAGLAAFGVDEIARRIGKDHAAIAVLLLAIEYANAPIRYVPAPQMQTSAGQWLRAHGESGAVVYLPLELDPASNTTVMVQSLTHGRPIVNGYSGERPSFFTALVDTMTRFPSAESLRTLLDLKVRFVVAPAPVSAGDLPMVETARFGDGVIYEIHDEPGLDSTLALPETSPLPEFVSIPFSIGEKAIYSVVWTRGPVSLPAGEIALEVRPGQNGARYELAASGTTAEWVSTVFRADDRFISQGDERLRSFPFEQHLKEGRRQIDKRAVFDRAARVVRLQQGSGPEVSVPISPDVLDPLAVFYYARTLPMTPGSAVRIPMNDSNRNLIVDLQVGGIETIFYKGVQTEAIRTHPRIRRAEGPSAAQLTIWYGRDEAKMPLRAEISGLVWVAAVRLELESVR